jgi:hypothetical protein
MPTEPKTKPTKDSVAAFLNAIEDDRKRADAKAIDKLLRAASGEKPVLWGANIIGYGQYESRSGPWPIIGFSPRKANLVVYMIDGYDQRGELLARLGKHKLGKSCLYLNKLADVDQDVLAEMAAASVAAMRAKYGG